MFKKEHQIKPSFYDKILEYQEKYRPVGFYQVVCTMLAQLEQTQSEKDALQSRVVDLEEEVGTLKVKMEFYLETTPENVNVGDNK